MALKYRLEYTDTVGLIFRGEISDVNWTGEISDIQGTAILEYSGVKSALEAIRGSVLTLNLEADSTLDLTDLYSENETDISIVFYRNDVIMFIGFIKPDGIYTDFVNELYTISLDCVDGLGTLKDLSFVDEDGYPFSGFMREIDIVYHCLQRTSLNMPINVNIGLFHNGITELEEDTVDVLSRTRLNTERFYKEDKEENDLMDCEEVLKSVLEKYCAIIHQYNGEWFIYRPADFVNLETSYFYRYIDGVQYDNTEDVSYDDIFGSQIDAFYPHHCNGNQRININGSVSAFRVTYKYGFLKSYFTNPNLIMDEFGNVQGWTLNYPATSNGDYSGLVYNGKLLPTPSQIPFLINNSLNIGEGYSMQFTLNAFNVGEHIGMTFKVMLTDGVDTVWYSSYINDWQVGETALQTYYSFGQEVFPDGCPEDPRSYIVEYGGGEFNFVLDFAPTPFAGQVSLILETIEEFTSDSLCYVAPAESYTIINRINITQAGGETNPEKGEIHTVHRNPKSSSITEENKKVANGDMESDIYEGTIKMLDNENTVSWRHKGKDEEKQILRIMVEDTLRTRIRPQKVFIGDVYGFIPFLKSFRINNVNGRFLPLSYSYDTKNNIVSLELVEIPNEIDNIDIKYLKTIDYGNVIKPTIV